MICKKKTKNINYGLWVKPISAPNHFKYSVVRSFMDVEQNG